MELQLERQSTSGHHFNCLAFSVMIGSEQLGSSREAQRDAREQSDKERHLTHEVVMSRLPSEAAVTVGPNHEWWAGHSCASLTEIFESSSFMNEAHVHGFANRLARTIVTIDIRELAPVLMAYVPGFAVQRQLSMRKAVKLRTSSERPIWVLLEPDHFSALLPSAMEEAEMDIEPSAASKPPSPPPPPSPPSLSPPSLSLRTWPRV